MRLIKLIAPTALIATIALFAAHADAQTMGEYGAATAGVASGAGSMGTSIGSTVGSDDLGGSKTWGASSLGASFDERAGSASGSGLSGCFQERAGAAGIGSGEARWPTSQFTSGNSGRFGDSSDRFPGSGSIPATRPWFGRSLSGRRVGSESPRAGFALQLLFGARQRLQFVPAAGRQLQFELTPPPDRLAPRLDVATRALLARSRPHVVYLVSSFEGSRTVRKSHPRQFTSREDMNVGCHRIRVVQRPRANE